MYSKRMEGNGFELKCRRSVVKKMHFSVRVVKQQAEQGALSSCGIAFHGPHKPALIDAALSGLTAR